MGSHLPPDVIAWRRGLLVHAGFERAQAEELAAASEVDLHDLLNLVDRGCPPHLAARIMAPLEPRRRGADQPPAPPGPTYSSRLS